RRQQRQQQERNHRDQLDRSGTALPVVVAAGNWRRHRPTVPGQCARVTRGSCRLGEFSVAEDRRGAQYVFASVQIRQIAATAAASSRIQSKVPPPLENIRSVPATSSAKRPKAP